MKHRLAVNPIACTGHGLCADMLPELIGTDEWGYPILADQPVPRELSPLARRAVRLCPTLALRIESVDTERKAPTNQQPGTPGIPAGRPAASFDGRPSTSSTRPMPPATRPTNHRAESR